MNTTYNKETDKEKEQTKRDSRTYRQTDKERRDRQTKREETAAKETKQRDIVSFWLADGPITHVRAHTQIFFIKRENQKHFFFIE